MMPFYGDVEQFKQAVTSVLEQSDPDFRLVVVDDGYPSDEPREWLAGLDDGRVHYERNAHNLGVNGNFRRCVDLVTADRYVVMGCDDVMLPGYLAGVRALADAHPDAAVIAPGVEVIDADDQVVRPLGDRIKAVLAPSSATVLRGEAMATSLYRGNWTYFPSLLWRTDAVRAVGFREGLAVEEGVLLGEASTVDRLHRADRRVVAAVPEQHARVVGERLPREGEVDEEREVEDDVESLPESDRPHGIGAPQQ